MKTEKEITYEEKRYVLISLPIILSLTFWFGFLNASCPFGLLWIRQFTYCQTYTATLFIDAIFITLTIYYALKWVLE
jgi:hypothetical protein